MKAIHLGLLNFKLLLSINLNPMFRKTHDYAREIQIYYEQYIFQQNVTQIYKFTHTLSKKMINNNYYLPSVL